MRISRGDEQFEVVDVDCRDIKWARRDIYSCVVAEGHALAIQRLPPEFQSFQAPHQVSKLPNSPLTITILKQLVYPIPFGIAYVRYYTFHFYHAR